MQNTFFSSNETIELRFGPEKRQIIFSKNLKKDIKQYDNPEIQKKNLLDTLSTSTS